MTTNGCQIQQVSTPKKQAFLAAYKETGNVKLASRAAKIDRTTHYRWLREDEDYAAEFDDAKEEAADNLEAEARRRAVEGVKRLKFYKGQPIMVSTPDENGQPKRDDNGEIILTPYVEHEYSDTLLIILLKGVMSEKYRERYQSQVSLDPNVKIVVERDDNWYGNRDRIEAGLEARERLES